MPRARNICISAMAIHPHPVHASNIFKTGSALVSLCTDTERGFIIWDATCARTLSTSNSVSGLGISVARVTRNLRPKNSFSRVRYANARPLQRRCTRRLNSCATEAISSCWWARIHARGFASNFDRIRSASKSGVFCPRKQGAS